MVIILGRRTKHWCCVWRYQPLCYVDLFCMHMLIWLDLFCVIPGKWLTLYNWRIDWFQLHVFKSREIFVVAPKVIAWSTNIIAPLRNQMRLETKHTFLKRLVNITDIADEQMGEATFRYKHACTVEVWVRFNAAFSGSKIRWWCIPRLRPEVRIFLTYVFNVISCFYMYYCKGVYLVMSITWQVFPFATSLHM